MYTNVFYYFSIKYGSIIIIMKTFCRSNSILNNSRLTTFSFKETEADNNWVCIFI